MSSGKCISLENFSIEDLEFGEIESGKLRDGTSFEKIPISVRRPDGSTGPLIIVTETCFSLGMKKDTKYNTQSIPLILCDKNKPTQKQKLFVRTIQDIISACIPKPKSCLLSSEENPIMYLKLNYDKIRDEFVTKFYERETMENKDSTKKISLVWQRSL